ncbi:MAG: hypothetical protein RBT65_07430 [Methanolobus sp.]|nr:hypothetical protein [Methanolobus sp.]
MKLKGIELNGTYKVICYAKHFEVYDEKDNAIYFETNNGHWEKWEYDEKGNVIYWEDSIGFWLKRKYDEKGNVIYFEIRNGIIIDKRVKELTVEEIENLLGYKIKIKGEKNEN